jgi:hypothetical protein
MLEGKSMSDTRLIGLIKRNVWWLSPEEAVEFPQRIIARIMDMGTFEDIHALTGIVGEEAMRQTLRTAEAGQFRPRSWSYWQYLLNGLADDTLPPMPVRDVSNTNSAGKL